MALCGTAGLIDPFLIHSCPTGSPQCLATILQPLSTLPPGLDTGGATQLLSIKVLTVISK